MAQAVAAGMAAPIRQQPAELVSAWLAVNLPILAKAYGNRHEVDDFLLEACCDLVLTQFKHLSLDEISEAYKLWAAGRLSVDGSAEMWGGSWNAKHLGELLRAYSASRLKIQAAILQEAHRVRQEQEAAASRADKIAQHDAWFRGLIEEKRGKLESWKDVQAFWYDSARSLDLIEFETGEAQAIYEDALVLAEQQLVDELAKCTDFRRRKQILSVLDPDSGSGQATIAAEARIIARKLTVYRKLLS